MLPSLRSRRSRAAAVSAAVTAAALAVLLIALFRPGVDAPVPADSPDARGLESEMATNVPHAPSGPGAADAWFYGQRAYPRGELDYAARDAARAAARALREAAKESPDSPGTPGSPLPGAPRIAAAEATWQLHGPTNVGGRLTDVVADPANPNLLYIAAASGGVWKTTDGGASWTAIFEDVGSLSVGALALDPGDPDILYVGTGEANAGGGSVAYGGDGMWKTTDGGATWTQLGLAETRSIGRIAVDPANPARVFVAATGNLYRAGGERGLYRSTDAGASWERVLFLSDSTGCVDIAIDPATPSRIYAAMWERVRRPNMRRYGGTTSGVWRSTDGGTSWTQLTSGLPASSTKPGRIGLAVAPSSPATVYAIFADSTGYFAGFYRSTDSGTTWTRRTGSGLGSGFWSSYGWWFGRIVVDPATADRVWAHGIDLYRSTTGGTSWSMVGSSMHVDHHAQWIRPSNPNYIWEGNDGGLYRTTNGGSSWSYISGLPITQFYTCEVGLVDPVEAYGGAQDNGTVRTPAGLPGDWEMIFGGDGHYVNLDPNSPLVIYVEYQYGNLYKSTDGGASFFAATTGISSGDRKNWSTPVVVDPTSAGHPAGATRLYYGANRLYRSVNAAGSWTAVSTDLTDGDPGAGGVVFGTITTIAVAPSDSATIYLGTDDGNVWVSSNYTGSWTQVDAALPDRWVTRVAVDPLNAAVAYATLSGFRLDEPLAHVYRTTNRGASWSDISGNLPDAPVNDIVVDASNPSVLYVATDVGVFATADLGASWVPLGVGFPVDAVVTDLDYVGGATPALYAGTYGLSMYRLPFPLATSVAATGTEGAGAGATAPASGAAPGAALLGEARPNPWRDETAITFTLPAAGHARLDVVDVRGRRVRTLVAADLAAGPHDVRWDGRGDDGREVPPGAYFCRLVTESGAESRRIVRVR